MTVMVLILILMFIYFIPYLVAFDKKNADAILVLNLFLGWTLLGWVAALIWAMVSPKREVAA